MTWFIISPENWKVKYAHSISSFFQFLCIQHNKICHFRGQLSCSDNIAFFSSRPRIDEGGQTL